MKIEFRGWKREVKFHKHSVRPVKYENNKYHVGSTGEPLNWNEDLTAYGRVDNLALTGSFLVVFEFEDVELKNWLRKYVLRKPEDAIRLLAEMQAEALIALHQSKSSAGEK